MVSGKKSISFTQNFSMQFWKYASYLWSRDKRGKRGNLTYLKWKSLICLKALYVTNQTLSNYRKQNNWSEVGKIFFSKRKTILPNCNFRMKTLQQFATFNLSFCSLSDCFYCRYFYNKNTTKKFIYFKKNQHCKLTFFRYLFQFRYDTSFFLEAGEINKIYIPVK
jgi:hypothetical protein